MKDNKNPIQKRKLTEAEAGMAKSLTQMKKPLTSIEKMQAERSYKRLIEENKRLNPSKKVGTDMSKVPSAAKKMMELKSSPDSTSIYTKRMLSNMNMADRSKGELKEIFTKKYEKNSDDLNRQKLKGKPGYDSNGFPYKRIKDSK